MELWEHFQFYAPNYKFNPKYKDGPWDGKIRLLNGSTGHIYKGLVPYIKEFANQRNFEVQYNEPKIPYVTDQEIKDFVASLNLPFEPYDHQMIGFAHIVRNNRGVLLCPTGGGKSLIAYMLIRWYDVKTLLIVPKISLVDQMYGDFIDYSSGTFNDMHKVRAGFPKEAEEQVTISTWQSLYKEKASFFDKYSLGIGDEVHQFDAKSLKPIMEKMQETPWRVGMSGTLKDAKTHRLVLEGLFGPVIQVDKTINLIKKNILANLNIKSVVLSHTDENRKKVARKKYKEEIDFIVAHAGRNRFIKNLARDLKGNTLILFSYVDKHGKPLFEMMKDEESKEVRLIYGKTKVEEREAVRAEAETRDDLILLASYGVYSEGVNIKNIRNVIFASPYKSKIRVLQSIGRGLRISDTKDQCTLFDISDDLRWKKWVNYSARHFAERIKLYSKEGFKYHIYKVNLKS